MRDRRARSAVAALVMMNLIWGMNFAFAKLAIQEIPPFTFNLIRTGVSLIVLLPLGLRAGLGPAIRENWRALAIGGAFGLSLSQGAFTMALKLAPSAIIAVLSALGPLSLALLAMAFLGERIARVGWLGMALATAGALLVLGVSPGELDANGPRAVLGGLIFLAGNLSWSGFTVLSKRLVATEKPVVIATGTALFGWTGMLPLFAVEQMTGVETHPGFWGIFGIFYAGILGTAMGFLILNWALQRTEGSRVGAVSYVQPVVGVAAAAIFLGERPGLGFLAGAILVIAGVFLVTISRIRTVARPGAPLAPRPVAASATPPE